jgi:hypothetical protein
MSGVEHTPNQRLLVFLHNTGAVIGRPGKTVEELATAMGMRPDEVDEMVLDQINSGYLEFSTDEKGVRHYKLTGRGIIRVSSLYT